MAGSACNLVKNRLGAAEKKILRGKPEGEREGGSRASSAFGPGTGNTEVGISVKFASNNVFPRLLG